MRELLPVVFIRGHLRSITYKITKFLNENYICHFYVYKSGEYRNFVSFLRTFRIFFSTFLTSNYIEPAISVWRMLAIKKPNIAVLRYVTVFLVLIISRVLTDEYTTSDIETIIIEHMK